MNNTRSNATRLNDSNAHHNVIVQTANHDFDHINTIWESDDWDLLNVPPTDSLMTRKIALAHSLPSTRSLAIESTSTRDNWAEFDAALARFATTNHTRDSLASILLPLPLFSHSRRGGIHFLRIGRWSISVSRTKNRVFREVEDRLERLLLRLIFWPAVCISVILLMEAIGISGR